jgi:hypothetical protein
MSGLKVLKTPSKGDQNAVKQRLLNAIEREYDEVFIIGTKDGALHTTWSGYSAIEHKLGLLELLKYEIIDGARRDV